MTYDDILGFLSQFSLYAWGIAAIASFIVQHYLASRGWTLILLGSIFIAARQAWKFLPIYAADKSSESFFNGYMLRFSFGSIGAILLSIGFLMLIANYQLVRSRLIIKSNVGRF